MPVSSSLPDRTSEFNNINDSSIENNSSSSPSKLATANNPTSNPNTRMEETAKQHFVIGDNLRHKSFYDDAIDEFQRALHIQESIKGEVSEEVGKTHYSLGLAYRGNKDYQQGLFHLNKAAAIFEELKDGKKEGVEAAAAASPDENGDASTTPVANGHDGSNDDASAPFAAKLLDCKLNIARCHHSNGVELQRSGDFDGSIVEHRKSLAIRELLLGRTNMETARSNYVIGCALSDRGDHDEALSELRRALRSRLLAFGRDHLDTQEVLDNMVVVATAKRDLTADEIVQYKAIILQSLDLENDADTAFDKGDYDDALTGYRRALSLEEQTLGDMHPTTTDLYLRMADAYSELGDMESSLLEYKSAISIYERMMGKFHVKVAGIYNKLAGILMDKGEYETALSFFSKAYGIFDSSLGIHDDTKQAMKNIRLAADKERTAKKSMGYLQKAEEQFAERQRKADEKKKMKDDAKKADQQSKSMWRKNTSNDTEKESSNSNANGDDTEDADII